MALGRPIFCWVHATRLVLITIFLMIMVGWDQIRVLLVMLLVRLALTSPLRVNLAMLGTIFTPQDVLRLVLRDISHTILLLNVYCARPIVWICK